jgi:hypothetical protein
LEYQRSNHRDVRGVRLLCDRKRLFLAACALCSAAFMGRGGGSAESSPEPDPHPSRVSLVDVPLGIPCSPRTDGWMPAKLPAPTGAGTNRDQLPVAPDGYTDVAPPGEPYCAPETNAPGIGHWAVNCRVEAECPEAAACSMFGQCVIPCATDADCDTPKTCEPGAGEGLNTCRCLECEQRPFEDD